MRSVILALSLLASALATAVPLPPAARQEVNALLARLEASGCKFKRNDAWHSGADARSHLQRKLEYIEDKASPASAEDFIRLAGTKSSSSGKSYEVQCGTNASVPSAAWLTQELRQLRHRPQPAK
jgi:hypothetical protein